jgi:serine protease Do
MPPSSGVAARRFCSPFAAALGLVLYSMPIVSAPLASADEPAGPPAAVLQLQQTFMAVIEQAEDSVVSIARFKDLPRAGRPGFGMEADSIEPGPDFIPNSFGTGIIVAPFEAPTRQVILTNYHVVKGGPAVGEKADAGEYRLYVRLPNRRGFYARILAADPRSDMAVLQIDYQALGIEPQNLKPLRLGDGENLKKGQLVVALGNPYAIARDGSASASWGMISNFSRRPALPPADLDDDVRKRRETIHHFGTLLQTDTRLNLGTSGGALLNLQGELIGVTTALAALEGYEQSVGYAIPIDSATTRIIRELAQGFEVEYGFLGIAPQNIDTDRLRNFPRSLNQISAARAETVIPNSPASAGRLQRNDVIVSVEGKPVRSGYDLIREVALLAPGTNVSLQIWRPSENSLLTCRVELGKWPVRDEDGIIASSQRYPAWQGVTVDYPTARERFFQGIDRPYPSAVVVTDVAPNSSADTAKLKEGDFIVRVNGSPVQTPAKFHTVVDGLSPQEKVRLDLIDGRQIVVPR